MRPEPTIQSKTPKPAASSHFPFFISLLSMDQFPTQQTHDRTKTKTKINPFLGCFGFSTKARNKNFPEKTRSDYHILKKKPLLLITWSTSRLKKSRSKRTVPVDAHTVSENPNLDKKINQLEKAKSKSDLIELVLPVVPEQNLPAKPQESSAQDIDLANQKQLDHLHAPKANKYRKLQSFSRKIDAIRNGSSQPGSPEDGRAKAKPSKIIPSLMRQYSAVSLPAQINQKQNKRVGLKKPNNRKSEGRLDPILGISVIMVTLIIMLLWGRLCAILCTSAWFYIVSMLRNAMGPGIGIGSDSKGLDINSEQYKKRVVLEGFLRRN